MFVHVKKAAIHSEKLKSDKILVYRFSKDETTRKWIKAIPNANLRVIKYTRPQVYNLGFDPFTENGFPFFVSSFSINSFNIS